MRHRIEDRDGSTAAIRRGVGADEDHDYAYIGTSEKPSRETDKDGKRKKLTACPCDATETRSSLPVAGLSRSAAAGVARMPGVAEPARGVRACRDRRAGSRRRHDARASWPRGAGKEETAPLHNVPSGPSGGG